MITTVQVTGSVAEPSLYIAQISAFVEDRWLSFMT